MDALVGQSLDRYQIVALLGEGGMGAVYKARDVTLQRDVAIKVLHRHIARQADFEARFLQEARSAARLDHPGIVQVHDFNQTQDRLYIVMKLIAGANLREMLQDLKARNQWMPLDEAIQLVQQVSLALDYAHRRGVLHRDIKPKNIMIDPEPANGLPYRPILTDLGLAKLAEGGIETRAGSSMGTPAYMSPEQAMGEKTDARSDVYSLGILLYELCTGKVPFPAKTITEAIRYHVKTPPAPPRTLRPDLPLALESIIMQALDKEPKQRFQDAATLARALDSVTDDVTAAITQSDRKADVSLITQYQRSLENPRGASILEEFDTPVDLSQDCVQVLVDDEVIASIPITKERLTIGRREDNDIVLDDAKASRLHARIEFLGMDYHIADLDSRNGTYLANARLLPGMPEIWRSDQALRIGNTWLRLVRAQQVSRSGSFGARSYAGAQVGVGGSSVDILLETAQFSVEPGGSTAISLNVLNQGSLVDHYQLAVAGVPAEWVSVPPALVHLMPGQQQTVSLVLHPPKQPQSRAGQHPITISATSQNDPNQVAQANAVLSVAAYRQYMLSLRPQRQTGMTEGNFNVTFANQCNTDLTIKLDARDAEDACQFTIFPPQTVVPAGELQEIPLKILAKTPPVEYQARTFTFTVTAHIIEAPDMVQQVHGLWVQSPPTFEVTLQPLSQRGESGATFEVHIANLGQMEITAHVAASDAHNACLFAGTPNQVAISPGQEQVVRLDVSPLSSNPMLEARSHIFTVTVQPVGTTGFAKQVQGTWEQLAPPPPPAPELVQQPAAQKPVVLDPPTNTVPIQEKPKRRWGLGCLFALFALVVTAFLGWFAGNYAYEVLNFENEGAWVVLGIVCVIGLIITGRITYRIIVGKNSK